jgi:hypothetical protein
MWRTVLPDNLSFTVNFDRHHGLAHEVAYRGNIHDGADPTGDKTQEPARPIRITPVRIPIRRLRSTECRFRCLGPDGEFEGCAMKIIQSIAFGAARMFCLSDKRQRRDIIIGNVKFDLMFRNPSWWRRARQRGFLYLAA